MLAFKNQFIFVFAALNLSMSAPVPAAVIKYDLGATWTAVNATKPKEHPAPKLNTDRSSPAPARLQMAHDSSGRFVGTFMMPAAVQGRTAALPGSAYANAASATPAPELTAATLSTPADGTAANPAGNTAVVYDSLLGPIPLPSLKWLFIGALAALAGLSRGTRGIHESV